MPDKITWDVTTVVKGLCGSSDYSAVDKCGEVLPPLVEQAIKDCDAAKRTDQFCPQGKVNNATKNGTQVKEALAALNPASEAVPPAADDKKDGAKAPVASTSDDYTDAATWKEFLKGCKKAGNKFPDCKEEWVSLGELGDEEVDPRTVAEKEDKMAEMGDHGLSVEVGYGTPDKFRNIDASSYQKSIPMHRIDVALNWSPVQSKYGRFGIGVGAEFAFGNEKYNDGADSFDSSAFTLGIPLYLRGVLTPIPNARGFGIFAQTGWNFNAVSTGDNRTGGGEGAYDREFASVWWESKLGLAYDFGPVSLLAAWNPVYFADTQEVVDEIYETIELENPLTRFLFSLEFDLPL